MIKKYRNQVAQETMVQQLIEGVQVQNNLTRTMAMTKVKDDKLGNWFGAVSYMETKVTEALRVANGNKNQGRRGNVRRISEVDGRGQGYVSIGQGRDWGGQGRGRGRRLYF